MYSPYRLSPSLKMFIETGQELPGPTGRPHSLAGSIARSNETHFQTAAGVGEFSKRGCSTIKKAVRLDCLSTLHSTHWHRLNCTAEMA